MDVHRITHSGKHHYFLVSLVVTILIFSSFGFILTSSKENNSKKYISCSINFSNPNLIDIELNNSVYTRIDLPGCINYGESGEPSLPMYSAQILIPYGHKIKDIELIQGNLRELDHNFKNKPIIPEQELLPFSVKSDCEPFKINKSTYNSNKAVNNDMYKIGETGFLRGYKIKTIYLYPVKYLPKSGLLYLISDITVKINLEKDTKTSDNKFLRYKESDNEIIKDLVENPEDIDSYENLNLPLGENNIFGYDGGLCDSTDNYEYVIITCNSIKDTTGPYNWSDLINHRQSFSSLSGKIVTIEDIDACSSYWNDTGLFNDTQAHMREFCKDAYQDWGTEYVLLGGNWGTSAAKQCVPFRLFEDRYETLTYDTMASDLYFSNLDGDFYYSGSGGMFGGGKNSGVNDLFSDLYVGRITAYNDTMVSNAVQKIINYDINQNYDNNWLRTIAFWGGDLGWSATSKDYMEEIRLGTDTYRTFTGFEEWNSAKPNYQFDTTERLYHEDLGSGYKSEFSNCVESDTASIINHLDHSSWVSPMGLTDWVSRVNTKPFFGYSQGCLAGRYHSGYSGCEQLICRHNSRHAFGLVLNTGYGYGYSSSTNGASQYINAYFWDYFFNNQSENQQNWQLGKAMSYTLDKMASVMNSKSHSWCYAWYSANFFGDPAQRIRLNSSASNSEMVYSNENPSDGSLNILLSLNELNITIYDPEGSSFNWSIETYPNIGSSSSNNDNNGTKTCSISGLTFSKTYTWFVNTTDASSWKNESYSFSTRSTYLPDAPTGFSANAVNRFEIELTWNDDIKADSTRVEWSNSNDQSWDIGDHSLLYNGSLESSSIQDLQPGSSIYFKSWSYNQTDNLWGLSSSCNEITNSNFMPLISSENPLNGSIDNLLNLTFSVYISDSDGDPYNVTIESSNGQSDTMNNCTNGTKSIDLNNLEYETSYIVWVNVSDSYNSTSSWYEFTTMEEINIVPNQNNPLPNNESFDISLNPTLSVICNDSDTENLNAYFYSNSSSSWQLFGSNLSFSSGSNISQINFNFSEYNTKYFWSVNLTDGNSWKNQTYSFTTRDRYRPDAPNNFNAIEKNRFEINLSWDKSLNSDYTIVEYNNNPSWNIGEGNLLYNGSEDTITHDNLNPDTTYYYQAWSYNLTDNYLNNSYKNSSATTTFNQIPIISNINPENNSQNISILLSQVSLDISDPEGDLFNYTIQGNYIGDIEENQVSNGTKHANIDSILPYNTTISWYVNISDNYDTICYILNFKTASQNIPNPPNNLRINFTNRTKIGICWDNNSNNYSYLEYNTDKNWLWGEGIFLLNSTNNSFNHSNLSFNTKYYYQIWSYNSSNNLFSNSFSGINATTNQNYGPEYTNISPSNGSTGISISLSELSIDIYDYESDIFDYNITSIPNIGNKTGLNQTNGTKTCEISDLSYSTTYVWYVRSYDGYNWTNSTYYFTTKSRPSNNGGSPPSPPPSLPPENQGPIAELGGPYQGYVNSNISFDASESYDSDGEIVNYTWDFDDGSFSYDQKPVHAYKESGMYNVSLIVTDNDDSSDVDYSNVKIIIKNTNLVNKTEDNESDINNQSGNSFNSISDLNDNGIPDIVEKEINKNVDTSESIKKIIVNSSNNYLVDLNGDGQIDDFINPQTSVKTKVKYLDKNTILIDEDADDKWDFKYNLKTEVISSYVPLDLNENNNNNNISITINKWFVLSIFSIVLFLVMFIFRRKLSFIITSFRLNRVNQKLDFIKNNSLPKSSHLHFFSKDHDKKHLLKHYKHIKKAKKGKSYYLQNLSEKNYFIKSKENYSNLCNIDKRNYFNSVKSDIEYEDIDLNVDKVILSKIDTLKSNNYSKYYTQDPYVKKIEDKIDNMFN